MPCIGFGECCVIFFLLCLFAIWKTVLPGNNSNIWIINLLWGYRNGIISGPAILSTNYTIPSHKTVAAVKLPPVPRPALPSPGDWNCPYSKGGRVEMGRKAFKDSIYLQLPEHCVKTKHRCQSLKIVYLLLICLPNVHSLFPIFMHTSPYSHEHNNIHFCQWQKWEMLQKRGFYLIQGFYWIWLSVQYVMPSVLYFE